MNFLIFLVYYVICTLFILSITYLFFKFILKKKCFNVSKFAEKEIDSYFNAFDNDIDYLLNDVTNKEDLKNDDTVDR